MYTIFPGETIVEIRNSFIWEKKTTWSNPVSGLSRDTAAYYTNYHIVHIYVTDTFILSHKTNNKSLYNIKQKYVFKRYKIIFYKNEWKNIHITRI